MTLRERIEKAYLNDNFADFHQYLKENKRKSSGDTLWREITVDPSLFQNILSSKNCKSLKFKSFILDELGQEASRQTAVLTLVIQSQNVETLLCHLMPDWFNPQSADKSYSLATKSQKYKDLTGNNLLEKLYKVIDDQEYKLFHHVTLRIIYQFFSEMEKEKSLNSMFANAEVNLNLSKILIMKNQEYKVKILQSVLVFWPPSSINKDEYKEFKSCLQNTLNSDEQKLCLDLAFMLKEKRIRKFQKLFEVYIRTSQIEFGEYFKIALKPQIRLLFKITTQMKLHKTSDFVFKTFPYMKDNLTIMKNFYDVQDFNTLTVFPFRTKHLMQLVRK